MKMLLGRLVSNFPLVRGSRTTARIHHTAKRFAPAILITGLLVAHAHAQRLWQSDFSDVNGWNQPQYGNTIMFGDINGNGRADVCGRGGAGIYCALSNGSTFGPVTFANAIYSDANGWNQPAYYNSIRLADVNGDSLADVCGRGGAGIYCAVSTVVFEAKEPQPNAEELQSIIEQPR